MKGATHPIRYLATRHIVQAQVSGFWSTDDVRRFVAALRAAIAGAPGPTPPACLIDFTGAAIQTREVVELMQGYARQVRAGRRVALFSAGPLARMQARRIAAASPALAVFDDRGAALAWLAAGQPTRDRLPLRRFLRPFGPAFPT